jgi:hypothetical protein
MILFRYKKLFPLLVLVSGGIFFYACDKDPEQPIPSDKIKATLVVEVMHHQWTIPNIPVYLKKNATEFPGQDTTLYELKMITDQSGYVQFNNLLYGNYYLFVHGWDPIFNDSVIGYKPVVISDSSAGGGIVDDRIFVSE